MVALARRIWRVLISVALAISDTLFFWLLKARFGLRSLITPTPQPHFRTEPFEIPVCVINLKKRPDRLHDVIQDLKRVGFRNIHVCEAVDGPESFPGILRGHAANLGCTLSHKAAVERFLTQDAPIAICEDDNQFFASIDEIERLIRKFLNSPQLDVLGLSVRVRGRRYRIDGDFSIVNWALAPAFYIVKPRVKKRLLAAYQKSAEKLKAQRRRGPFDQVWRWTQRFFVIFAIANIRVAGQRESPSDIQV